MTVALHTAARAGAVLLAGVLAHILPAAAQPAELRTTPAGQDLGTAGTVDGTPRFFAASPLLDETHWAVRAAARAEALGLAPGYLPAQRAVPRAAVAAALAQASARARSEPALEDLTRHWWELFVDEFPEYAAAPSHPPGRAGAVLGGAAGAGYGGAAGRVAPATGFGDPVSRQLPRRVPDSWELRARGLAAAAAGPLGVQIDLRLGGRTARLERWDVAVGAGPLRLSAGRESVGYGYARGGGIVFSASEPLLRAEAQTARPVRLPWLLGRLGGVSVHTFLSRVRDDPRHPEDPFLWGMRLAARPHPRLTLAVNRGALFGGEGDPLTARTVAGMLVGVVQSEFENQVLSLEARYRLPTERVLPATAYLEWGADDAAGALDEQPALVAGVLLPRLPGVPGAAAGAEYAYFKDASGGHGAWYYHNVFRGNWARGNVALGHPLGGEGTEYAAYGQVELLDARLRVQARAFARRRSSRSYAAPLYAGNLFTPLRGRSAGGEIRTGWRLARRVELHALYAREAGHGWREHVLDSGLSVLF